MVRQSLPPLVPSVKRSTWRMHDPEAESADEEYREARMLTLERDHNTCQFCGFSSISDRLADKKSQACSGFLEVHHLDDDHHNNELDNLVAVCPFCHQVFHCGNAGFRNAAQVIWFPWMSQADLNLLVNAAAVAIHREGRLASASRALINELRACDGLLSKHFDASIADASNLGTALMGAHKHDPALYERRGEILQGIRLLPITDAFERAVAWWSEFTWLPEQQWPRIYRDWLMKVSGGGYA